MRQNRIIPVFVVAAAVAVTGTACASSGTTGSAQGGGSGGSGDSGAVSNQAITLLAKMTAPQAVAQSTKAVAAKQSAKVHMTLTMPMLKEDASGAMSFGSSLAMNLTLAMSSTDSQVGAALSQMGQIEMRMSGTVAYVNMGNSPQWASALQGKKWMKIDFNNLSGVPGLSSFSFMKDLGKNNDPSMKLKDLMASPNLKKVGQEQRDGVQTLHFAGTVDPNDLVKDSAGSGLSQQDLDSLAATAKQAGVTNTSYDLWVDGSGLPVEIKFSENTAAGAVAGDLTYSDWGSAPVTVTAPPADQTVDIAQLLKNQQG
ncbi:hypothetical protein [Catenulispora rubra]|uniref:hypothetical protein n=1 Tax=Catenulispora rubra TaxID=280293 RepID=UPI0018920A98|nr:hypothetical protein [Catenulispora rubra]